MALVRIPRRMPSLRSLPAFSMLDDIDDRIRRVFDDALDMPPVSQPLGWLPPTEIVETKEELILTSELPGLVKKDVEISIDNGVLTIRGEKTEERKEGDEERRYHLWERTYGSFTRSFTLPPTVDAEKIVAEFENGILRVRMPKTLEAKTRGRKIEVLEKEVTKK